VTATPTSARAAWRLGGSDALGALAIGAVVVATWPLLAAARPLELLPLIAHISGMLAGYGVLILLLFVARTPSLELDIGADRLARWHVEAARWVLILVGVHAGAAIAAWAQARRINLARSVWEILFMPWLPAATLATLLMLAVATASIRAARRRIRHERWHALHLLMYLAVALAFGHQLAGPDLVHHRWLQVAWALGYAYVFAAVLRHRLIAPLTQATRHRMRVSEVHVEGDGVVSIVVEGQDLDKLRAESGQFFRWRFLTPDHWWNAHPFSLSAPPSPTHLRLTVKCLGDGTAHLQRLPVGTWVIAEGPYGAMTSSRRTRRNVLLVAGGVGITPMRALFETLPVARGEDVLLLYRAREEADILFREELDTIAARRGVRVIYLLGRDRAILSTAALRRNIRDLVDRDVFMCGPPGLTAAVREALLKAGVPSKQLHEERFSS
jgi:predicted ferric reductase